MIPMHKKFIDDIFARFLVIKKNVVISFIKEYKGPNLIEATLWRHRWRHHQEKTFWGIIWDDLI